MANKHDKNYGKLFYRKCKSCNGTGRVNIYRKEMPCKDCNQGREYLTSPMMVETGATWN